MQNIFIELLPPWVETGLQPAFYDKESGSVLQQTARMYAKLNELVGSVNNQNSTIADYIEQFNQLHDYVDDYFEDLNVQEEINTKLDQMAQSGELGTYFERYVTPIIEELDDKIETTDNKVNNIIESGVTPLTASSTSEMLQQDRIYVNTTNGYWYYYNGSDWVQGGEYQGVNLSNKSVHYQNLDQELQDSLEPVNNITDIITLTDGKSSPTGTIGEKGGASAFYEFSVSPMETYKIHINVTGFLTTEVAYQFLNSGTVVSNVLISGVNVESNNYTAVFTVPTGVNTIRINTLRYFVSAGNIVPHTDIGNYILKVGKYTIDNISKNQLDSTLQSFFNNQYEEVQTTQFIDGAFCRDFDATAYASTEVLSLSVNPHDVLRISGRQVVNNPFVMFTVPNKYGTFTINGNSYNIYNYFEIIKSNENNHDFSEYVFEIPEYCDKIYINHYKTDTTLKVEKCTSYKIAGSDIIEDYDTVGFKKLIAVGDSITEVNWRALHNYLYWIKEDMPSLTIQNLGASGTGYMNGAGVNNTFANRINSISSYDEDTDVVIVMGSINDMTYVTNSLGQLGDTTESTVYGSIYKFFNDLFTKFNGVRVGCISPINWKGSSVDPKLTSYLQALKETCELFNVPYLDIHAITNLRPDNDTFLNSYYLSDGTGHEPAVDSGGVHPNSNGHKLFYQRIKEFIKTL